LEGALKLKEISYIHAEGYPAGEMKHGPIALIDEEMPVVMILQREKPFFEKTLSNLKEVEARGARLLVITDAPEDRALGVTAEAVIRVPVVAQHSVAALGLPCGGHERNGCRPSKKPRQECNCRIGHNS
jgi:glucosamine--fructose-6-phosphate aminotransferase (isomerizing)